MGVIAESIAEYARPLLEDTDGSNEQINQALQLGQICWNLAILPEEQRNVGIDKMESILGMTAGEFAAFRETVISPMIRRHQEMFPRLHEVKSTAPSAPRSWIAATAAKWTPWIRLCRSAGGRPLGGRRRRFGGVMISGCRRHHAVRRR